jgi:hypothetical protein
MDDGYVNYLSIKTTDNIAINNKLEQVRKVYCKLWNIILGVYIVLAK